MQHPNVTKPPVRRTYVEFFFTRWHTDGDLISGSCHTSVGSRDLEKVRCPGNNYGDFDQVNIYAMQFHDTIFATVRDGENFVELKSENINHSGMMYFGGTLYTLPDEAVADYPADKADIRKAHLKKRLDDLLEEKPTQTNSGLHILKISSADLSAPDSIIRMVDGQWRPYNLGDQILARPNKWLFYGKDGKVAA